MLKKTIKKLAKSVGIDLRRYDVQTSEAAKMQRLLAYHNIDLVFDVGANIGQYAKLLRVCPRISLLWFRNSQIEQARYHCQGLYHQ